MHACTRARARVRGHAQTRVRVVMRAPACMQAAHHMHKQHIACDGSVTRTRIRTRLQASTKRTSGLSCISRCPNRWKAITRRGRARALALAQRACIHEMLRVGRARCGMAWRMHARTCRARAFARTQETGRAGRDGKLASCVLYYSYGDAVRTRHMLRQSAQENGTPETQLQCNMESLNSMARIDCGLLGRDASPPHIACVVDGHAAPTRDGSGQRLSRPQVAYCEETVECRRVMLLTYFGELEFTADRCRRTCDVCQATADQVRFGEAPASAAHACDAHALQQTCCSPRKPHDTARRRSSGAT